ncbi:MAG: TlpA disulfide reductase family protein [Sulfuricaulis sp.]|nr:TlpA disulfide reductase family protein [Sulfuricaulis sp.]
MNDRRHGLWRYAGLALWLAIGATAAEETKTAQTLPAVAKPFAAPDFTLKGEDGKTYRLSDYRGQVVLLNFWATWCPPCRYEMPSMERAHRKVKGKNIAILAVNVGEDENTVFAFTGHYPVTFPLPLDIDGSVIQKYPVIGLPTTYVIDPRGNVTHRAVGSREWDDDQLLDRLRKLLKP